MTLSDLIAQHLPAAEYQNTPIWNKDAERLTPSMLLMATQVLENKAGRPQAEASFQSIMEELDRAFLFGQLHQVAILKTKLNRQHVNTVQITELLKQLNPIEGRAVLYAAIEDVPLNEVVELSRNEAVISYKTKLGFVIIKKSVPHFKSPLLFWRLTDDNQVAPLKTLKSRLETIAHLGAEDYLPQAGHVLRDLTLDQQAVLDAWL